MKRDDEDWFDVLAGHQVTTADTATKQEALALRAAVLKMHAKEPAPVIQIDALQRFKQRLQDEGLLAAPAKNTPRWMALAATLVICGGLAVMLRGQLLMQQNTQQDLQQDEIADVSRGAVHVEAVKVAQAQEAAQALQQKLAPLGITLAIQGDARLCTVEAFIPADQEVKVNAILEPYQKTVGSDGHLLLEFHTQGQRP